MMSNCSERPAVNPARRLTRAFVVTAGLALAALVAAVTVWPAHAQNVESFYRGRTVTVVIGFSVGGGYDLYARLLARHLGKHIPGQPTVLPQNREGAGSERALLYLYNAAPRDGTVIGTFSRSMVVAPLIANAPFDATKFSWIGSMTSDISMCVTWKTSPVATFADMLIKPFTMGGLGAGADPDVLALMMRNVFGAKLKLVSGYPGTNDVTLAVERGEINGLCGLSWVTFKSRHQDWLKGKLVNVLVQMGFHKEPESATCPACSIS